MEPSITPFHEEDDNDSMESSSKQISDFLSEVEKSEVQRLIDIKFSKHYSPTEVYTVFTILMLANVSCNIDNGIMSGAA